MKSISAGLSALVLVGAAVVAVASPAAALTLVNCVGTTTVAFSPGITNTSQTVAVSGSDEATTCLSLTHPGLTSFSGPFSGTATQSCTTFFGGGSGTETLHWNDSTTSTWNYTNSFSNINGTKVGTSTGTISTGTLAGASVTQTITFANLDLTACTTTGLTELNGTDTWTFTAL
ncbi:hypothetical protein EDD29_5346 [Actinocorallia herbida]|uniref:Ig-like domain-containing protein n=1 Tax=Actinocorallia herbida TaxID=58109 RepID=A0A3N1D2L0_9ACTN|nr:hypothetical protein [Actinocorallia herbida]ROO87716.1 hypothetical protein EDD29_5346 [Actinocorallia herbida]